MDRLKAGRVMRPAMDRKARMFVQAITCKGCGRKGSLIWDANSRPSRTPIMANLASISDDFYLVMPLSYRGDLEIVCSHCGAVQDSVTNRMPTPPSHHGQP